MERTIKVLGGFGAGLAIVVAGVSGGSWLMRDRAEVADAEVSEAGNYLFTESPHPSAAYPSDQPSVGDLYIENKITNDITYSEHWIVDPGADVEEFPVESVPVPSLSCFQADFLSNQAMLDCLRETPGCTPGQESWLRQNAVLASPRMFTFGDQLGLGTVVLKNTGSSEQSITFKDIRLEAKRSTIPDAGFSIICTNFNDFNGGAAAGHSSTRNVILTLELGSAVFGEPSSSGEDLTRNIPAGMPAVFNLAAGETANANLSVIVPSPVGTLSGEVLATVSASKGEQQIKVPLESLDEGDVVYTSVPRLAIHVDGGAICPTDTTVNKKYTREQICSFTQLKLEDRLG